MLRILEVIPFRRRVHTNGRTNSIAGACPWNSDEEAKQWRVETKGWTWRLSNGTTGLGRQPVETKEAAEEIMRRFNHPKLLLG